MHWAPVSRYLWGPIAPGWKLEQPLALTVERDADGSFIVSDDVFCAYGHGQSWDEAEQDYVSALLEYHDLMAQAEDEPTRAVVQHLRTYLRPD